MLRSVKYSPAFVPFEEALLSGHLEPSEPQRLSAQGAAVTRPDPDKVTLCCPGLMDVARGLGAATCRLGRRFGHGIRSRWQASQRKPPTFVPFDDPRSYEQIQDDRHKQWAATYAQLPSSRS